MISDRLTLGMGHVGEDLTWRDAAASPGKVSYYYVRGEQENGEIVWASPNEFARECSVPRRSRRIHSRLERVTSRPIEKR